MIRFCVFGVFLLFLVASPVVSAGFFPNASAIPPDLRRKATENVWNSFLNFTGCHAGMKVNGLYKIKQYFQYFGYIPQTLSGNFTDDFDDILKNAVEMYQRNFQLNITGELDELTLQHVVIPRCGVPDVVNGTSTMHSNGRRRTYEVSFTGRSQRFQAVKRYSFFPGEPRWPEQRRNLTYAFDPQNPLPEEVKSVFSRAFVRWAEVIPLTFRHVESYATSDISIGFYAGEHGDGEPFDGLMGTLAHAFSPPNGHFHLDSAENWLVSGDVGDDSFLSERGAVDLESVAVHEIGHLLGLGHSSVQDSIMYPTITTGRRKVDLTSDDVEGVQYLYGANPNFNGTRTLTPSTQQRDTGAAGRIDGSRSVLTSLLMSTVGLLLLFIL